MNRNGVFLSFENDVQTATEKQLKDWLTSENTLKIIGVIDEVTLLFRLFKTFCIPSFLKRIVDKNNIILFGGQKKAT